MAQLGVYVGNDASAVLGFENWLGRSVDGVLGYVGHASWADFVSSAGWAADTVWSQIDRPVYWSVPLIVNGATLEDAAAGHFNEYYRQAARELADSRPQDGELYIRTGWEFNGDWFPWKAEGKEQAFIGAFRQFVDSFRAVSDRFVFEWNVNESDGWGPLNPETAYPGDAYVDIIGMDFYYNPQWDSPDAATAWKEVVNEKYGLQWHQDFAAAHGKPTSYSEWGVTTNDAGSYVEQAEAWFESHNVVYQTYWDSDAAYPGKLSDNSDPNTGNAYIQAFFDVPVPPKTEALIGTTVVIDAPAIEPSGTSNIPMRGRDQSVQIELARTFADASATRTIVSEDRTPPPQGEFRTGDLKLSLSGDHYRGAPTANVYVDNVLVGDFTITADQRLGQWQDIIIQGAWADGVDHQVRVGFNNDAWEGTPDTDRNLWIRSAEMNDVMVGTETVLMGNSTGVNWLIDM